MTKRRVLGISAETKKRVRRLTWGLTPFKWGLSLFTGSRLCASGRRCRGRRQEPGERRGLVGEAAQPRAFQPRQRLDVLLHELHRAVRGDERHLDGGLRRQEI